MAIVEAHPSARPLADRRPLTVRLRTGQALFHEGDNSTGLYQLVSGALRTVRHSACGHRTVLDFVFAGGYVGFPAGDQRAYTADALAPSVIERCGRRGDDRASVCLDAAAEELAMARAAAARLTVRCAHQRLAALLLHLQARQRACGPLWLPMSRTDIAAHLALTLETVSRSFAYLKARRLIATPDLHTVDLLDRPRLALLAAPAVADAGAPLGHA